MRIGDLVAVVDPASPDRGRWGLFAHTTRAGDVVVKFLDGRLVAMDPFQVEDYSGLVSSAVLARQGVPARKVAPGGPAVHSSHSQGAASCKCGHPDYKHREYRGYVACTCLDGPRRQCHCRSFNAPSALVRSALGQLFEGTAEGERDEDEVELEAGASR